MSFEFQILLKTTLILLSAGVLSLMLRRSSAALRHAVWVLAMLAVLTFPLASILLPPLELPILAEHTPVRPAIGADVLAVAPIFESFEPQSPAAEVPLPSAAPIAERWFWRQWLTALWAVGALFVFVSWLVSVGQLRRLKKSSAVVEEQSLCDLLAETRRELGVTSRVELRIASELSPPMTWGFFRHVILLGSVNK